MATPPPTTPPELSDPFLQRTRRLANYVERASRAGKGIILFAVWRSVTTRRLAERSLEELLEAQGHRVVRVNAGDAPSGALVSYLEEVSPVPGDVLFIYDLERAGEDGLRSLNYRREDFVTRPFLAVFWLRESELNDLTRKAPDFWVFRHRVVEFPEIPQEPAHFSRALREVYGDASYQSKEELQSKLEVRQRLLQELPEDAYAARIELMQSIGVLYGTGHNFRQAEESLMEALRLAQDADDQQALAQVNYQLGQLSQFQGRPAEAEGMYHRSLEILERSDDQRWAALVLLTMGKLAQDQGRPAEAEQLYRRSLQASERLGDQRLVGAVLTSVGDLAREQGLREEAEELYRRSLETSEQLGDQRQIAIALLSMGDLARSQGKTEDAEGLYRRSLEIFLRLTDQKWVRLALLRLGHLAREQGRLEEAEELYRNSLDIAYRLGDQLSAAIGLSNLGLMARDRGRPEEAERLYRHSLEIFEQMGDQQEIDLVRSLLAELVRPQGHPEE